METIIIFVVSIYKQNYVNMRKFRTIFMEDVADFFVEINENAQEKILYNIDKAEQGSDPELFKKLTNEIWEFRTKYGNLQYRLFAFWDKRDKMDTLVVCSHGIIKKTDKVPSKEISKAEKLRTYYFDNQ